MNLTGLLDNPHLQLGMGLLAQDNGVMGNIARGFRQTGLLAAQQQKQEIDNQYKQNQIALQDKQLNAQPQRRTMQDVNGINRYVDDGSQVFRDVKRAPPETEASKLMVLRDSYPPSSEGWNYYDQIMKNKSQPRQETMVKVQTPNGVKYMPQSQAAGMAPPVNNGTNLTIGENGEIQFSQGGSMDITKPVKTDVQKKMFSALETLDNLGSVADKFSADYLTVEGRGKAFIGEQLDYLGQNGDLVQFSAKKQAFNNEVMQMFNSYRKEITGAAASEKEMKQLLDSMVNANLPPQKFMATYNQFMEKARSNLERNALLSGIEPNDMLSKAGVAVPAKFTPTGNPSADAEAYLNGR